MNLSEIHLSEMKSTAAIIAMVETLSYRKKWSTMIELGRSSVTPAGTHLVPLFSELAASKEYYDRFLAAMSLRGVLAGYEAVHETPKPQDIPEPLMKSCLALCRDSSRKIYSIVLGVAAKWHTEEALLGLLRTAPSTKRRKLCYSLVINGRQSVVDQALRTRLLGPSLYRSAPLLPFLSTGAVVECLATPPGESQTPLLQLPSRTQEELAQKHAKLVYDVLTSELEKVKDLNMPLPPRLESALVKCAWGLAVDGRKDAVDMGLSLIEASFHRLGNSSLNLQPTLERYCSLSPMRTARYLGKQCAAFKQLNLTFSNSAWKCVRKDPQLVVTLIESKVLRIGNWGWGSCFSKLPAEVRRLVYMTRRETLIAVSGSAGEISPHLIRAIPDGAAREAEALRCFNLKGMESNPTKRVNFLGVLPFAKAVEMGSDFIGNPDPALRIAAVEALMQCCRYHPEDLGAALDFCVKRVNEQEPWRRAMLTSLASISAMSWKGVGDANLRKVEVLVQAAYDARDTSDCTFEAVERLLLSMCIAQPVFVATHLPSFMKRRDSLSDTFSRLNGCPSHVLSTIFKSVLPQLIEWAECGFQRKVVSSLRCFDLDRVFALNRDELHELLAICLKSENANTVSTGIEYMDRYFRQEALEAAVKLIEAEKDAICVRHIATMLMRDVQGPLVEQFLVAMPELKGRFNVERYATNVVFYISFPEQYLYRLSGRQQHSYAQVLVAAALGPSREVSYQQRDVLLRIANLPSASLSDGLAPLAAEDYESNFVRDITLTVLGRMQDEDSLRELIAALGDARARIAITAIHSRLKIMETREVIACLQPALDSKMVTVQKEVVRFIGDRADEEAVACLEKFASDKGDTMHKDVRIAYMRGMWSALDVEKTWATFEKASHSDRVAECIAITNVPVQLLTSRWQVDRYCHLLATLLASDNASPQLSAVLKVGSNVLLEHQCLYEPILALCDQLGGDRGYAAREAMEALLKFTGLGSDRIVKTVLSLKEDYKVEMAANILTDFYNSRSGSVRYRIKAVMEGIGRKLIQDRRQLGVAVKLLFTLGVDTWVPTITAMESTQLAHPGVYDVAVTFIKQDHFMRVFDKEPLQAVEATALRAHASSRLLRRMGLEVVKRLAKDGGWTDDLRSALTVYQGDADCWVRDDARLVHVPPKQ